MDEDLAPLEFYQSILDSAPRMQLVMEPLHPTNLFLHGIQAAHESVELEEVIPIVHTRPRFPCRST